jgi:hypothetical protein
VIHGVKIEQKICLTSYIFSKNTNSLEFHATFEKKIMKAYSYLSLCAVIAFTLIFCMQSYAQITITSTNMPQPGDEMPMSRKLAAETEINGHTIAGTDVSWNFSGITKTDQQVVSYISPTSNDIQYICIAIFNNPLDPEHNSTMARRGEGGGDPMGNIQVTDVFEFFKLNSSVFSLTGRSSNVNGVPTCVRNIPVDTIYTFPLEYGDTIISSSAYNINVPTIGYYGQTLHRHSVADAWGSVTTPFGTFEALRIKSTLQFTDSIYYESMGFGMMFPHTETHYTWLSTDYRFPVFVVEEKGVNFGGTIAFWADSLDQTNISNHIADTYLQVFPNPASDFVFVSFPENQTVEEIIIYDFSGREILRSIPEPTNGYVSLDGIPAGLYILTTNKKELFVKLLVH